MQRAGSGLNVNLHFHTLVLDGVFTEEPRGALAFHPAPAPTDAEVAAALATIRYRVQRLLVRRGLEPADDATGPAEHPYACDGRHAGCFCLRDDAPDFVGRPSRES